MIQVNRHTLDNGLRIVHSEDKNTQMVALNVLYNVGARDEHPDHTGFAHLFEHLMFGGSVNIPDYDTHVQNAGGEEHYNLAGTPAQRVPGSITVLLSTSAPAATIAPSPTTA